MDFTVLLGPLFQALGVALAGVFVWVAKKKLGVELTESQQRTLEGVVSGAVGIAEEAARKAAKGGGMPLTPDAKLSTAKAYVRSEQERLKLPALPPEALDALIHARLGVDRIKYKAPPVPPAGVTRTTSGPTTVAPR